MNRPTRNAVLLFAGEAASRIFGFLATTYLARRLGLDGFGQVGFAAAVFMYGAVLTDFGLLTLATRTSARDRASVPGLAGTLLPLRLTLAGVVTALVVLLTLALPKPALVKWLIVTYTACAAAQALLLEWAFFGIESMGFVSVSRILTNAVFYGLILLLVRGPGQILLVPGSFALAILLGAGLLFSFYVPRFGWPRLSATWPGWLGLIKCAWPIGAASVFTQLHVNFGLVGLGLLRTDAETGLYTSAYRLVFFLLTLDRVFYTVFFPVVSRFAATQRERLPELTGTAVRLILCLALPLCTGLLLMARPILALVFGAAYTPAALPLRILTWFLALSMLDSMAGYSLVALGQERRFLRNAAAGSLVSLGLNLTGIISLGVLGAAAATLAGEATIMVLMFKDLLQVARPKLDSRVLSPVLSSGLMAVVCILLFRFGLAASIAGGAVSYCALLLLSRGVAMSDFGLARSP